MQADNATRGLFESLMILAVGLYLCVDTLNGFIINKLAGPNGFSAVYKQILLLLCLMFNLRFDAKRLAICFCIFSFVFTWALVRFIAVDGVHFSFAFQESIKSIFYFILVITFSGFRTLSQKTLLRIVLFCIAVILFNIATTFLGFGFATYGSFGAKGFFHAGNALSGVIIICSSVLLCLSYQRSTTQFFTLTVLFASLALIIGTKSGFIGVLLIAVSVITFNLNAKSLVLSVAVLFAGIGAAIGFWDVISDNLLFQRVKHFYEVGGINYAIFSGRDVYLKTITPLFSTQVFTGLLLGLDHRSLVQAGVLGVEFDWMDMVINFGLLFTLIVYSMHLVVFLKLISLPTSTLKNAAVIGWLILMLISTVAGHVLYNGMVTPLWAVLTATAFCSNHRSVTT